MPGVADRPAGTINLAQQGFRLGLVPSILVLDDLDLGCAVGLLADELIAVAELLGKRQHECMVGLGFEHRLDDFFAPLQRAVRRGDRSRGLELGRRRQQVDAVLAHHGRHRRGGRRIRIDDDQQIELFHRLDHFLATRLAVRRMTPENHRAQIRILIDELVPFQHAVDPARHRHAGLFHHCLRRELALDPLVVDAPRGREVLPRAGGKAIVARQRVRIWADVGRTLHVVVTAEDVRTAAGNADIAQRELDDARRAHDGVADRMLRLAHAPDECRRPVLGHHFGDLIHLRLGNAGDLLDLLRRPLGHDFILDLVHAVDPVVDVLLVFPAVLEHVIEHPEQERNVRAGADPDVDVGLRRGARETRIDHDHPCAGFLGVQHVQHRHRMRFGGIRADVESALGVLHIVVRIGHRTVAPGVGYAGDGRRVADPRLMIHVVGAEERHELAHERRLLVVVLRAADPEHRIGSRFLADREQAVTDFVDCLVPGNLLPLAVDELHRRLQPMRAGDDAVIAHRCALGAMRAEIQR